MTLREKLEGEANDLPSSVPCFDDASASSGAKYMLDLLWPVIEAAQRCAIDPRLLHPAHNAQYVIAQNALSELEARLETKG